MNDNTTNISDNDNSIYLKTKISLKKVHIYTSIKILF